MRGSGRFRAQRLKNQLESLGLNPLHCGAVVASSAPSARMAGPGDVSIPFIAGQWSLLLFGFSAGGRFRLASQSPSLRGSGRFTPTRRKAGGARRTSQSPSLRGSGRFLKFGHQSESRSERLNPLHCGAVVASRAGAEGSGGPRASQSPSLRGSGRFRRFASARKSAPASLNPLHCGAVVASGGSWCATK